MIVKREYSPWPMTGHLLFWFSVIAYYQQVWQIYNNFWLPLKGQKKLLMLLHILQCTDIIWSRLGGFETFCWLSLMSWSRIYSNGSPYLNGAAWGDDWGIKNTLIFTKILNFSYKLIFKSLMPFWLKVLKNTRKIMLACDCSL